MVDPIFDYQFRVILIGDSTVGKSSLLRSFTDGTFAEVSDPTVGVDFFARLLRVMDGTVIKLQLWDTAGQERFRSITKSYYRNSVGALLVYDVCNRDSFKHIPQWMAEAKRHIEPHRAVFVLVGCKRDIAEKDSRDREVSQEEATALAAQHGMDFVETSAKTGKNVVNAFALLTQTIYDKIQCGDYRLEDGWDGIKRGYFGINNNATNQRTNRNGGGGDPFSLVEAEAADRRLCC